MRQVVYTTGNRITLLHRGAEFFPALIEAFDAATAEIYHETYIFSMDPTGLRVMASLKRAAARGVLVHVIADWLGTGRAISNELAHEFSEAGVHYRCFNPWFVHGVARTHRKICVVDRQVAFLGGLNINDDHLSDIDPTIALPAPRWDFGVRIAGPLVFAIQREVEAQWARLGHFDLKSRWKLFKRMRVSRIDTGSAPTSAALVVRDNLRNRRTIQRAYLHALGRAHKSAMLATPYFAPGKKLRDALASAARRGVDVTLLLGAGEFPMQDAVAHAFYPGLLKSGVKIVEYRRTQLHGKVAVVDDEWATVGSSNYDGLSLFVNQEANIVIKDAAFARALREHIEQGIREGTGIPHTDFDRVPLYKRAWYGAAYMLYRSILTVITLGRYSE